MRSFLRRRLAVRTAVVILLVMALLGSIIIAVVVGATYVSERNSQQQQLEGLVDTVINTASIAVFLEDSQLAAEIADGLLANDVVASVSLRAGDTVLASAGDLTAHRTGNRLYDRPQVIRRNILSPFPPQSDIGVLVLESSPRALAGNIQQSAFYAVLMQFAELLVIGICVVMVVMRLITRPITTISNRLHNLNITLGEKIPLPSGQHRKDEIGQLVHDVNVMVDRVVNLLTTEKSLRQELEVNEQRYRNIFENASSAIVLVDGEGRPLSFNVAFLYLFGLSRKGLDDNPQQTLPNLVGDQGEALRELMAKALVAQRNEELEIRIDGDKPRWLKMVLIPAEKGTLQVVANEITSLKDAVSEVEKKTLVDPLTGLGNRSGVERKLAELLDPALEGEDGDLALFFIDLDHFKEVNDTHGHQAGDLVLIRIAEIIQGLIRKTDYAARLGGDEFVVILPGVTDDHISTRFAGGLIAGVEKPMALDGGVTVNVGASIGIARGRAGQLSPQELMKQADAAMYQAKEQGRHRYCFYGADARG